MLARLLVIFTFFLRLCSTLHFSFIYNFALKIILASIILFISLKNNGSKIIYTDLCVENCDFRFTGRQNEILNFLLWWQNFFIITARRKTPISVEHYRFQFKEKPLAVKHLRVLLFIVISQGI